MKTAFFLSVFSAGQSSAERKAGAKSGRAGSQKDSPDRDIRFVTGRDNTCIRLSPAVLSVAGTGTAAGTIAPFAAAGHIGSSLRVFILKLLRVLFIILIVELAVFIVFIVILVIQLVCVGKILVIQFISVSIILVIILIIEHAAVRTGRFIKILQPFIGVDYIFIIVLIVIFIIFNAAVTFIYFRDFVRIFIFNVAVIGPVAIVIFVVLFAAVLIAAVFISVTVVTVFIFDIAVIGVVAVIIFLTVAGIFTMGESEGFFRLYDAVSIGMLEISMAEIYVNQGGDEVTRQMTVMAKEAAKWQIFMMGMQLCLHIAVTPVGGQAPLAVRASSSKSKPKALPKVSEKQFSTGKKAAASQKVIKESTRRQQAARDEVRSPGARAKSKGRKPKKSLAEGIKRGETRAIHDINELETMMHRCKANPTPENLQQLRRAVINVQGNKQAMYRLKALGPEYNEVRKTFNLEMLKIYDETDQAVMYELAAKHGLSLDRMGKENVSLSDSGLLKSGETITYDRDSTYFYIDDKGNKIYFGQKTTQAMYNRFFTEAATGYKGGSQKVADNFTKYMDGTVIEDVLNHPESFGKEDIKILTDSTQHYKPLNNAKQVRDTIIYKTKERLAEGDKLLKMAESIADPELRKNVEARAVSAYMEGNRQTWKDFKHFVKGITFDG